jgi:hypothetical protein
MVPYSRAQRQKGSANDSARLGLMARKTPADHGGDRPGCLDGCCQKTVRAGDTPIDR